MNNSISKIRFRLPPPDGYTMHPDAQQPYVGAVEVVTGNRQSYCLSQYRQMYVANGARPIQGSLLDFGLENIHRNVQKIFKQHVGLLSTRERVIGDIKNCLVSYTEQILNRYSLAQKEVVRPTFFKYEIQEIFFSLDAAIQDCFQQYFQSSPDFYAASFGPNHVSDLATNLLFPQPVMSGRLSEDEGRTCRPDKKKGVRLFHLANGGMVWLTNRRHDGSESLEYGRGGYGRVRGGWYWNQTLGINDHVAVAIKKIPLTDMESILTSRKELNVLDLLRGNDHVLSSHTCFVYDSLKNKNLEQSEAQSCKQLAIVMDVVRPASLELWTAYSDSKNLSFLYQIALGIKSLHAVGIVHNDLKIANSAIKPDGKVCLLDFGCVLIKGYTFKQNLISADQIGGSYPSPECYKLRSSGGNEPQGFDRTKIDIWAFGVMLYQVFYPEQLDSYCYLLSKFGSFDEIKKATAAVEKATSAVEKAAAIEDKEAKLTNLIFSRDNSDYLSQFCNELKEFLQDSEDPMDQLIMACLDENPNKRPSVHTILSSSSPIGLPNCQRMLGDCGGMLEG